VPPGHIWIQGDNPTHSLDSRQYGAVPLALVRGRVVLQVRSSSTLIRIRIMAFLHLLDLMLPSLPPSAGSA
jgi:hypothetical protein